MREHIIDIKQRLVEVQNIQIDEIIKNLGKKDK